MPSKSHNKSRAGAAVHRCTCVKTQHTERELRALRRDAKKSASLLRHLKRRNGALARKIRWMAAKMEEDRLELGALNYQYYHRLY